MFQLAKELHQPIYTFGKEDKNYLERRQKQLLRSIKLNLNKMTKKGTPEYAASYSGERTNQSTRIKLT